MKKIFLVLFVAAIQVANAQNITDSLVGHYKFDGSLLDYSGNANDIVYSGGSYSTDRFGNANSAFKLNGLSDSLLIPTPEFAPIIGDFTISFWYKTNSSSVMNLFSSKQFASDTTNNFEIQLNSNSSYYLENFPQSWYQTFAYWNGSGLPPNGMGEGNPGNFVKGEWSHFLITREADTLKIFRDHQHYIFSSDYYFGGPLGDAVEMVFSAAPFYFKGAIDDLRLYNRKLSQQEIDLLWFENQPIIFIQPQANDAYVQGSNLLVYWEYDQSSISDSILVEYRLNNGSWIAPLHSNLAYENYTYINLSYAPGTKVEVRVTDIIDPLLFAFSAEFTVSEYDWEEVAASLPFPAKDGAGLLNFDNKMWLLGGWDPPYHPPNHTHSEVWNSTDGASWNYVNEAPWQGRHCSGWISSDDNMWVIGGDPQSGCLTDVWNTEDGINWVQVLDSIPGYTTRNMVNQAYFDDYLFLFGGEDCAYGGGLNEVWRSADGLNWTQLPDAPWSGRGMQLNSCVDDNGELWMLGGSNERDRRTFNEVWKTADGLNWTLVNESAPWSGRYWHTIAWFDHKMWLLGGMASGIEMNDVWYSEDGITWNELKSTTDNWPAGTRHAQSTIVYNNALWYMCGMSTNNVWKIINTQNTLSIENEIPHENEIHVFPNPTSGILNVQRRDNCPILRIEIFNSLGQVVFEGPYNANESLDVSHLHSGIYFVRDSIVKNKPLKFVKN